MITLGINAAFHDSAAALVVDGAVVAAAEEERFTRIKHAKRPLPFTVWELPFHAIDSCLAEAGVSLGDVDHVAYSFDPAEFAAAGAARDAGSIALPVYPGRRAAAAGTAGDGSGPWDPLFAAYVLNAPDQLVDGAPHHLQQRLGGLDPRRPPFRWHFVGHHLCHQASAFLAAPFEDAAVMTLDGRGERATTTYGAAGRHDGGIVYRPLGQVDMPNSLGLLYEGVTTHLGFLHSSDEYKVMALAALGEPTFKAALRDHVRLGGEGRYVVEPFDAAELFGPARLRGALLGQSHFDIAASLQAVLEDTVLGIARWLRQASGEPNLALAGGVALNCVMNARLRDSGIFERVWVQPAAGDAGTALGAALWVDSLQRRADETRDDAVAAVPPEPRSHAAAGAPAGPHAPGRTLAPRRWSMAHAYLGPGYADHAVEAALSWAKLPYRRFADADEAAEAVAALLADNCIVGWFQGRMEYGPRALGARSILASPIDPDMQARLNELKDREDFRPVAPAVLAERFAEWFEPGGSDRDSAPDSASGSPFMLFVHDVVADQAARIPSACHSDRSARVQTVDAATNPRLHALLAAFERRTGVPVLVNTSFNVRGQPIVCTPRDAIEAFFSTPLDALAIGSFLVQKR